MKRKIILGLSLFMSLAIVGGGFVALNGVAETNDPVAVEAVDETTTDNNTHKDAEGYISFNVDYNQVRTSLTSVYIHYFEYDASGSETTWPGEVVSTITDNLATVYVPTPSTDDGTGKFVIDIGSNSLQTGNIYYTSANAGDTFIIYGTDSTSTSTLLGTWASSVTSTLWDIPGKFNKWTLNTTTATAGGDAVSVNVEGGQTFRMILGDGSAWSGDYTINAGTPVNFGGTTATLLTHYSSFLEAANDGDNNFKLTSSSTGTLTFKFGTGLYAALMSGRDATDLLSITFVASGNLTATYVPVVTNGYYGQTATISAEKGTLISAITPELYGYKFTGWYTDRWCDSTKAVSDTDTIDTYNTSGAWLYAKFEADATTYAYTNYEFDFSEALSVYKGSDSKAIFVYYYRAADETAGTEFIDVSFPGINVGDITKLDGLITTAVPNDATHVILSCYSSDTSFVSSNDSYNTKIRQTKAVSISNSNPAMVFLDGNYDSNDYNNAYAYQADAGYQTIKNALTGLIDDCATTASNPSTTVADAITSAWEAIDGATSTYKTNGNLKTMGANDKANAWSIAGCLSRYDFIVNKYTSNIEGTYNPLNRTVNPSSSYHFLGVEENSHFVEIIAVVAIAGIIVGGFFFLRKRKGENA